MALSQSLVVSVLLHAAVVGAFSVAVRARASAELPPALPSAAPNNAAFGGETFDIEALLEAPPSRRARAASVPVAEPEPEPKTEPKLEPESQVSKPASTQAVDARGDAPAPKKPKKRRARAEAKPAPSAEAGHDTASSEGPNDDRGASYGAQDLPPGVRHLAPAFTRAVAAATHRDPFWTTLEIGSVGKARVVLEVDEEGHVSRLVDSSDPPLPAALERLVDRTLVLLRTGRFALSRRAAGAGRETLEIDVTLAMIEPPEDDWDEGSSHTAKMGFVPPEPGTPGRAFFVHGSGRRFDARVSIISQKAR